MQCPLCGMNRSPENFRAREVSAKEVQSLGGNRGMKHTSVPVPVEVERELARAVAELHQQLNVRVKIGDEIEKVQEGVSPEEIEAMIDEELTAEAIIERMIERDLR